MKSEFLENELELYVQRLLVHESYNTGNRYKMLKISPSEERLKGYDAKIVGLTPFYCQFKTSDFLTQGKLYKSREAFLKAKGWPSSPFYSFGLRVPNDPADKKNPRVWQHNILHQQWKTNPSGVSYVAPSFHTRFELDLMEPSVWPSYCPLIADRFQPSSISIQRVCVNGKDRCMLPFFDGLISIPPHLQVKDLGHHYCFTSHQDVTFHSNPEPVLGAKPFGSALREFVERSIARPDNVWPKRMSADLLRDMLGDIGNQNSFFLPFIRFGLLKTGMTEQQIGRDAASAFESEANLIQQHVAIAASMHAYFGITTLGLLKVE